MGYEKAALGYEANNNNLEEGKAAWLDRPINPDEPNIIIIPISDENFTINIVNGLPVYGGHLAMLNYIKMPDRKFRLQLYNDGQGNFIVTAPLPRYKTQKGN